MTQSPNQYAVNGSTETRAKNLKSARVAILVADGVSQAQLDKTVAALRAAGAHPELVGLVPEHAAEGVQAVAGLEVSARASADLVGHDADPAHYDAAVIPGGISGVDALRESRSHLALLAALDEAQNPILAIGHGAWLLADSGVARGRTLTSAPSIRKDLERGGAVWKEPAFIQEGHILTAQTSEQLDEALAALVAELGRQTQAAGLRFELTEKAALAESPAYAR